MRKLRLRGQTISFGPHGHKLWIQVHPQAHAGIGLSQDLSLPSVWTWYPESGSRDSLAGFPLFPLYAEPSNQSSFALSWILAQAF